MDWHGAEASDSFGRRFFSRSPLHSGYFVTAAVLFLTTLVCCTWLLLAYRARLSYQDTILILIGVFLRALHSMQAAVMRHSRLRAVYTQSSDGASEDVANAALGVAARAILDDVFYTSLTLLTFLFVVWLLLHYGS